METYALHIFVLLINEIRHRPKSCGKKWYGLPACTLSEKFMESNKAGGSTHWGTACMRGATVKTYKSMKVDLGVTACTPLKSALDSPVVPARLSGWRLLWSLNSKASPLGSTAATSVMTPVFQRSL